MGLIVSKVKFGSAAVLPSIVNSVFSNKELKPSSNAWIVLSITVSFNLSDALPAALTYKNVSGIANTEAIKIFLIFIFIPIQPNQRLE